MILITNTHTHTYIKKEKITAYIHLGFHARTLPNSSVPKTGGEVRGSTLPHARGNGVTGGRRYRELKAF